MPTSGARTKTPLQIKLGMYVRLGLLLIDADITVLDTTLVHKRPCLKGLQLETGTQGIATIIAMGGTMSKLINTAKGRSRDRFLLRSKIIECDGGNKRWPEESEFESGAQGTPLGPINEVLKLGAEGRTRV